MTMSETEVQSWVGRTLEDPPSDIAVERGYITHWCESVENANPMYWDDQVAQEVSGGPVAPPTMLSVWMRPLVWRPGRQENRRPLELHFQLKDVLDLPEGIVLGNEIEFRTPARVGDRIRAAQSIREIGEVRTNRLGTGRSWTIDVTYTNQRGDVVGIETYVMFGYRRDAASEEGPA
jgi:acyl dehydratase